LSRPSLARRCLAEALATFALVGDPAELGATHPSVDSGAALTYEIVLTATLMFVIMAVATDTRAVGAAAAIAIGGTVALGSLYGGDVTGASMNPARSLGPALAASSWTDIWIYLVGPVAGALVGGVLYQLVRRTGVLEPDANA
jgi:aquaporin NIP